MIELEKARIKIKKSMIAIFDRMLEMLKMTKKELDISSAELRSNYMKIGINTSNVLLSNEIVSDKIEKLIESATKID